jgi:hypothetical protein
MIKYLVLLFIIFIIFYILNINIYEYFEKQSNGLLCGNKNDICRVDQSGNSSCCSNLYCVLPEGKFKNKICSNSKKIKKVQRYNNTMTNLNEEEEEDDNKYYYKFPQPSLNINLFSKKYWTGIFAFGDEFNNEKDDETRRKLQAQDICKHNKINLG